MHIRVFFLPSDDMELEFGINCVFRILFVRTVDFERANVNKCLPDAVRNIEIYDSRIQEAKEGSNSFKEGKRPSWDIQDINTRS